MTLNIIQDKSSFQQLGSPELALRERYFIENVTPVLIREILGDLAKQARPGTTGDELVATLARKFFGSGGPINWDYRELCIQSLLGTRVPMTGQILPEDMEEVTDVDGSRAYLLKPGPGNRAIMRWAQKRFVEGERIAAKRLRGEAKMLGITSMEKRLDRQLVVVPKVRSLAELPTVVGDLFARLPLQRIWIAWLLEELEAPPEAREAVRRRWLAVGGPRLSDFAPYAAHCVRAFLLLVAGMKHGVLTARPSNRVDIEYLLYLPFCEVFVSADRLHHQLGPPLARTDQSVVRHDVFRADLQRRVAEREALDTDTLSRREFAFGSYPWPLKGSILSELWSKHQGPWRGSGNRAVKLSSEEQAQAIAEAQALVRDA